MLDFQATLDPSPETVDQISDLDPANPFHTNQYIAVRANSGAKACSFVLRSKNKVVTGCLGFLTVGRMNSRLEITSCPALSDPEFFWRELFAASRRLGASVLSINSFASVEARMTNAKRRVRHKHRGEYRLDLTAPDIWKLADRRSRRKINLAIREGVEIRRSNDIAAREAHVSISNMSLDRLRGRGEVINGEIAREEVDACLDLGAGEIFMAVRGPDVLASILVARAPLGGYAQSSGSTDQGRALGASHYLFHMTARALQQEGLKVFNLGGADEHSTGLQEFKLGLGGVRLELESAEFYIGSTLNRLVTRASQFIRR